MAAHILAAIDLLRWPAVILVIGVVAIFAFRTPLGSVIGRLKRVKAPGIEAEAAEQTQAQAQTQAHAPMVGPTGQLMTSSAANDSMVSELLKERAKVILKDPIVTSTPQGDARDDLLAKHLAAFQVAVGFERIYQHIFGSQIQAIRLANRHMGVSMQDLNKLFVDSDVADDIFGFENWMNYIHEYAQFVTVDGNMVIATELGREFLKYLVQMRYSDKDWGANAARGR